MQKGTELPTTDADYTEWGPINDSTLGFTTTGSTWNLRGLQQLRKALSRQVVQNTATIPLCCLWWLAEWTKTYSITKLTLTFFEAKYMEQKGVAPQL